MIKYLGSKRRFVTTIGDLYEASGAETALDLFTGTTRVAQELCQRGAFTTAVDTATYSEVLAQCFVETDVAEVDIEEVEAVLARLDALPGVRGYFTQTFCEESRYLHPDNGMRVDAIRQAIEDDYADDLLKPIYLTSLLLAADAVDSTVGLQMAYLKQWAPRALNRMTLKVPKLIPGTGRAIRGDALTLAPNLPHVGFAYLDPPYNQHRYFTNYHVWETLIRWDKPDHYGTACKRIDARDNETKSPFNSKRTMPAALAETVAAVNADVLVLSFSNEGFVPLPDLVEMCGARGDYVAVLGFPHHRYVGAKIGIHDLKGKKVGKVSHLTNTEYMVVSGEREKVTDMIHSSGLSDTLVQADSGRLLA
ncbi:DNA adenine methylase [Actinomyces minihominis]|uniref:DNA adenine methylase n=1 Tax=Actinomyces minihominis TaxID=2002838 RepID=UPI000C073340|nr:DNA adenine methylase [Actinomyces minihominis]